jgi:glycosyltransferase involved in cell wall biosynthesis
VKFLKDNGLNVKLNIVGFLSDEAYYEELIGLINRLKVNHDIEFMGSVEQQNLESYYQESDLLLMPSQHESFGMVMVEAMACGCPVVGYKNSGGTDEIIKHNYNGLLVTPDTMQTSVFELLSNTKQLNQLRKNAVEDVNQNWSIEVTTRILSKSIKDGLQF